MPCIPAKDVDGFHPQNVGLMQQGRPRFLPCTPAGVMRMLEVSGIATSGKHAVVIGRSDIVGKPMAALLAQKGADATVTLCHSRTPDIGAFCREADILVAALGMPRFVKGDMVKPGAVVIDVGINRVGERLVGDVDYAAAALSPSAITPVPGGVGPMTIAMLLEKHAAGSARPRLIRRWPGGADAATGFSSSTAARASVERPSPPACACAMIWARMRGSQKRVM